CISDTLVPTTYLVDTTLSNSSDSDQTVQAVRLLFTRDFRIIWYPDMGIPAPSVSAPDITTDIVFLAIN
ncbi:hypothetical protein BFF42_23580, partial [Shigella sp. FC1661]